MQYATIESPLGALLLAWKERGLTRVSFLEGSKAVEPASDWMAASEPAFGARAQLDSYFSGHLTQFDLPLAPGGTAFQQAVWSELTRIPFAETASLRGNRASCLPTEGESRRRSSQRQQSAPHNRPVPPSRRQRRQPYRLFRRDGNQGIPARPRGPLHRSLTATQSGRPGVHDSITTWLPTCRNRSARRHPI